MNARLMAARAVHDEDISLHAFKILPAPGVNRSPEIA